MDNFLGKKHITKIYSTGVRQISIKEIEKIIEELPGQKDQTLKDNANALYIVPEH